MNALELCITFIISGFAVKAQIMNFQNLTCSPDDLKALKGFMTGMQSAIDGWYLGSSNCCDWVGITCNSFGRTVKLELSNKKLVGILGDSLGSLDQLRTLNLSHNLLKDPLPSSLFYLPHLEILDLSSNEFSGSLPLSINLPSVHFLDLSDNNFEGPIAPSICTNSTGVRILKLSVNYFSGTIPLGLADCGSLEQLSVDGNLFSGNIPEYLFRLPKLEHLTLNDNRFTGHLSISNPCNLVYLDVSLNELSGNVPDIFHQLPNLSYFSAHSNNFFGDIPPSLSNSHTISSLRLGNNSLDGSINLNCSAMVSLVVLDLGNNNFSGSIPDYLPSCQKLRAVNLAMNPYLTGQIPETFKNFQSLTFLSLSNCNFTNLSSSLRILQHCPNLTVLVLTKNFLSEQLPSNDNLQFKALKLLVIANCRLTGTIPLWLKSLTQLQLLDLSWNHLTGSIPPYMGDLKSLFYLDLSNNSLSGEIPKSLTRLPSLISRNISLVDPSEGFPFFKRRNSSGRGSGLQYNQIMSFPPLLDFSNNLLNGSIWPEFGNLKKLQILNLQHNYFSGTIPSSLSGMTSIETLDLSYNHLTGTIPRSLVKLSFLSKFSVAYNNLSGVIPYGGQFSTFTNSSFEGNQGLCCEYSTSPCEFSRIPQESVNKEIVDMPVWVGLATGFLLSVMFLNVLPAGRDKMTMLLVNYTHR